MSTFSQRFMTCSQIWQHVKLWNVLYIKKGIIITTELAKNVCFHAVCLKTVLTNVPDCMNMAKCMFTYNLLNPSVQKSVYSPLRVPDCFHFMALSEYKTIYSSRNSKHAQYSRLTQQVRFFFYFISASIAFFFFVINILERKEHHVIDSNIKFRGLYIHILLPSAEWMCLR